MAGEDPRSAPADDARPGLPDRFSFALMGAWYGSRLRRSGHRLPRATFPEAEPHTTTTVTRLPWEVTDRLAVALSGLRESHPEQYHYPPRTTHVTILNLDRAAVRTSDADLAQRARTVAEAHPPFELSIRGLNLSSGTVFAQAFSPDGGLASLRRKLSAALGLRRPVVSLPAAGLLARLAFANVVRFTGAVRPSLVGQVRALRDADFGRFLVERIELVRTDKVLSGESTTVIAGVSLNGSRPN